MEIRKDKKALDKLYRRRDRFDLQPDFQRQQVWSKEKKQKLMDTILNNWHIPTIYLNVLNVANEESFEVIDGQQRLNAVYEFYSNDLPLSKSLSGEYGGLYYNDLPDKIKDIFDDHELELVLVHDASEKDIKELFSRLQLGVPLNSAEKLNAMHGGMRDFVKQLTEHSFFSEKTPLSNRRFAYQAICAQIALLGKEGIRNAKFTDLEEFYKNNQSFNMDGGIGKKILQNVNCMDQIFDARTSAFRNRGSIISFYLLISELMDNGCSFNEDTKEKLKNFYIDFNRDLQSEVEKGADAEDAELIVYQSKISQAADSKDSILKRHQILRRRLVAYDESFKNFLKVGDLDIELTKMKKMESIKELANNCIELMGVINNICSGKGAENIFKPTTDMLNAVPVINTPAFSHSDFKHFIDALYKLIYEGTGQLKRIPEMLRPDNSVFFDIKHLRTDAFHDVEHGAEKEIQRKKKHIAGIYKRYSGKSSLNEIQQPSLVRFQKKLLEKLQAALYKLKEIVSSK